MRLFVSLFLITIAACGDWEPDGGSEFQPPFVYRAWWSEVEQCVGQTQPYQAVQWFTLPGRVFECPVSSGICVGWWTRDHHIYLAEQQTVDEDAVKHEMLHSVIDDGNHPEPPFGVCAPVSFTIRSSLPGLSSSGLSSRVASAH